MKIESGKNYITNSGRKVRIYATDGAEDYPIHGAIYFDYSDEIEGWRSDTWMKDGKYTRNGMNLDIKEEIK